MANKQHKVALDLMVGLVRKGWILSSHAAKMTKDLETLIEENDTLREALDDKSSFDEAAYQKKFGRYSSIQEILD